MPGKVYIKDESFDPIYDTVNREFYFRTKIFPSLLIGLGFLVLITQVVIPLVFFKTQDELSKPVTSTVLGVAVGFDEFEFEELKPNVSRQEESIQKTNIPDYFYLTVPKLNIHEAVVKTESDDLSPEKNLGHYKGSALPGDKGNAFIYGHSVLPWFFNPKNYKTIFSTLGDLDTGDKIYIRYNNKNLSYVVYGKEVSSPNKVDPLAKLKPDYLNDSTITLMTCWPAGSKAKRLMVYAERVD